MALSQIQCLDDHHVNWRVSEGKPEFFYSEDQRLAIEALICKGREAFTGYLHEHGVREFLSDPELERVARTAEAYRPGCEPQKSETGGATPTTPVPGEDGDGAVSLQYWPDRSEASVAELDLGWPEAINYRGVTRVSVYTQPPVEGHTHIKEVVRKSIASAQKVIAVVMDVFTDVDIFRDLLDASYKRRIPVYIILDPASVSCFLSMCGRADMHRGHLKNLRVRCCGGVEFYTRSSQKLRGSLSQRFLLVDGDRTISGSYSFTWTSSRLDRNLITVVTGQAVETFDQQFRDLYLTSRGVSLNKVPMADEPIPEPIVHAAPAPISAAIARKLINPKYALVTTGNYASPASSDQNSSNKNSNPQLPTGLILIKGRGRERAEAPPLHPGLAHLERAYLIPYLPTWPEPDPPSDVIGFINIRDEKRAHQVHLQRSERFEVSQAIRFSSPFTPPPPRETIIPARGTVTAGTDTALSSTTAPVTHTNTLPSEPNTHTLSPQTQQTQQPDPQTTKSQPKDTATQPDTHTLSPQTQQTQQPDPQTTKSQPKDTATQPDTHTLSPQTQQTQQPDPQTTKSQPKDTATQPDTHTLSPQTQQTQQPDPQTTKSQPKDTATQPDTHTLSPQTQHTQQPNPQTTKSQPRDTATPGPEAHTAHSPGPPIPKPRTLQLVIDPTLSEQSGQPQVSLIKKDQSDTPPDSPKLQTKSDRNVESGRDRSQSKKAQIEEHDSNGDGSEDSTKVICDQTTIETPSSVSTASEEEFYDCNQSASSNALANGVSTGSGRGHRLGEGVNMMARFSQSMLDLRRKSQSEDSAALIQESRQLREEAHPAPNRHIGQLFQGSRSPGREGQSRGPKVVIAKPGSYHRPTRASGPVIGGHRYWQGQALQADTGQSRSMRSSRSPRRHSPGYRRTGHAAQQPPANLPGLLGVTFSKLSNLRHLRPRGLAGSSQKKTSNSNKDVG